MTSKSSNGVFFILLAVLLFKCDKEEKPDQKQLLIGQWNLFEIGDGQNGFASTPSTGCHCLTFFYEDGISFSKEGTYGVRYIENGNWIKTESTGPYVFKGNSILITHSAGTTDESTLELQLLKLDENHLWFKHSLFDEREFHLERVD